ncbi:MAG TPA: hypothetical protein ENN21_10775 [Spirochaetes bacterium]|nr:hypothetical protein [Spirochaetota bacterium]
MDTRQIELKIADLKFRERDLIKEVNRARGRYLYNAEKSATVNSILETFFIDTLGVPKNHINKYSQLGNLSGRAGEEFVDDVIVSLYSDSLGNSPMCRSCGELTVKIRINSHFDEPSIRRRETELMDEILALRDEVDALQLLKKNLKQGK